MDNICHICHLLSLFTFFSKKKVPVGILWFDKTQTMKPQGTLFSYLFDFCISVLFRCSEIRISHQVLIDLSRGVSSFPDQCFPAFRALEHAKHRKIIWACSLLSPFSSMWTIRFIIFR